MRSKPWEVNWWPDIEMNRFQAHDWLLLEREEGTLMNLSLLFLSSPRVVSCDAASRLQLSTVEVRHPMPIRRTFERMNILQKTLI